jgi:hypothetical protein
MNDSEMYVISTVKRAECNSGPEVNSVTCIVCVCALRRKFNDAREVGIGGVIRRVVLPNLTSFGFG